LLELFCGSLAKPGNKILKKIIINGCTFIVIPKINGKKIF
jgi:hypothetical protein